MTIKQMNVAELKEYENNPRHNESAVDAVAASIKEFGFKVPIVVDVNNVIVAGHTRKRAAEKLGLDKVPCIVADDLTPEQINAFRLADNKTAELAEWDFDKLEVELAGLADLDMSQFGFDLDEFTDETENPYDIPNSEKGSLNDAFIVPPFSILDGRAGYWLDRKREWKERIIDKGQARENAKAFTTGKLTSTTETSILDPVLSEIIMKWFFPEDGKTAFDCFAGDTVFGYVSATLGAAFTGIELRQEQAEFNQEQINKAGLNARYICDDGRNVAQHIPAESQDLFFSCPPYFDLEVYSDKPNDASNQKSYDEFYKIINDAFTNAVTCLKENRFAVVVVGDIRNKKTGEYYGFADDVKRTFRRNGLLLYNELILVDPVGTAAIRAANSMRNRKVVKTHQNVLVFYKGNPQQIKESFAVIEYNEEDFNIESENE